MTVEISSGEGVTSGAANGGIRELSGWRRKMLQQDSGGAKAEASWIDVYGIGSKHELWSSSLCFLVLVTSLSLR